MKKKHSDFSTKLLDLQLLPRLKIMGLMLLFLSITTLCYGYFSVLTPSSYDEGFNSTSELFSAEGFDIDDDAPPFHLNAKEKMQFYMISATLAFIGSFCLAIVRYKKKQPIS